MRFCSMFSTFLLQKRLKNARKSLFYAKCGNKVTIKKPLIATRYTLIIRYL